MRCTERKRLFVAAAVLCLAAAGATGSAVADLPTKQSETQCGVGKQSIADGYFCHGEELDGHKLHYGHGLTVGRIRSRIGSNPGQDIVVSDTQPPRLTYTWFDRQKAIFIRHTIFEGPTVEQCHNHHNVPRSIGGHWQDCLVFEQSFIADIDCDGLNDVVVLSYSHPVSVFWFKNPGRLTGEWKRFPISNPAFASNADLRTGGPYSLAEQALVWIAPVHSGRKCGPSGSGRKVVDVLTAPRTTAPSLVRYTNPMGSVKALGPPAAFTEKWQDRIVVSHASITEVRSLFEVASGDGSAKQRSDLVIAGGKGAIAVPNVDNGLPNDLAPKTISSKTTMGSGTLATINAGQQSSIVLPFLNSDTQQPCSRNIALSGVEWYESTNVGGYLPHTIFSGQHAWPRSVAAGRISAADRDDLVVGTVCSKVPGQDGDVALSEVVWCRNPESDSDRRTKEWACTALGSALASVPFVAVADVDGDGIADIVAQTSGFSQKQVPGGIIWYKGLRRPQASSATHQRLSPSQR